MTIATKAIQALKLPGLNVVSSAVWAPDSRGLIYMQPELAGAESSGVTARIIAIPNRARLSDWDGALLSGGLSSCFHRTSSFSVCAHRGKTCERFSLALLPMFQPARSPRA